MTIDIDDETETAWHVFGRRHEKTSFPGIGLPLPAARGDHFDHAGMMIGAKGGDDDPVIGMGRLESATVLHMGFTGCQGRAGDRFPSVPFRICSPGLSGAARNGPSRIGGPKAESSS